jgi:hypothetical protein
MVWIEKANSPRFLQKDERSTNSSDTLCTSVTLKRRRYTDRFSFVDASVPSRPRDARPAARRMGVAGPRPVSRMTSTPYAGCLHNSIRIPAFQHYETHSTFNGLQFQMCFARSNFWTMEFYSWFSGWHGLVSYQVDQDQRGACSPRTLFRYRTVTSDLSGGELLWKRNLNLIISRRPTFKKQKYSNRDKISGLLRE